MGQSMESRCGPGPGWPSARLGRTRAGPGRPRVCSGRGQRLAGPRARTGPAHPRVVPGQHELHESGKCWPTAGPGPGLKGFALAAKLGLPVAMLDSGRGQTRPRAGPGQPANPINVGGSSNLCFEGDVDSLMVHGPYMWEPIGFQNSSQLPTSCVKFSPRHTKELWIIMNSTHSRDSESLFGNRAVLSH